MDEQRLKKIIIKRRKNTLTKTDSSGTWYDIM